MNAPIFSTDGNHSAAQSHKQAHIIVLGNEKGGSGKTTTGMHLIIALLRLGFTVGSIDVDSRQRSLSRYMENRQQTAQRENVKLPQPHHIVVSRSPLPIVKEAEADDRERFTKALERLAAANDFVVVDSPGSDTYLARLAHTYADTVITPINDSFVDLDVLATVDGQTMKIIKPSIYSEMMWEQKLMRAKRDGGSVEWIVMRNRLSNIDAKNKRFMTQVTADLSRRIGFRVAPGFSERVIFREMFLQGLTVLDITEMGKGGLSLSHVAARQEVRDLLKTLKISKIDERLSTDTTDAKPEEKKEPAAVAAAQPSFNLGETNNGPAPSLPIFGKSSPVAAVVSGPSLEEKPVPVAETKPEPVAAAPAAAAFKSIFTPPVTRPKAEPARISTEPERKAAIAELEKLLEDLAS